VRGEERRKDKRTSKEGRGEGERKKEKERKGWNIVFWNVAGLNNKDKDFWKRLERWDIMILVETWTEEKGWEKVKNKLPKGYKWGVQWASREGKRGRAKGGMIMGVKKDMMDKEKKIFTETEGLIIGEVRRKKETWRIIGVYVGKGIENMKKILEKWIDDREGNIKILVGGDFNARVGREGGGYRCNGEKS